MKIPLLAIVLLLAASCGGSAPDNADLATTDLNMSLPPGTDGGGTKQFGDRCSMLGNPGDCGPGLICDMFAMGTVNRCTRLCDSTPTPTNCPPPSAGTCNGKGECKFLQ